MPEISVVVPSHARSARLSRLLDALGKQTLAPGRWELIVVHDNPDDDPTEELLRTHPLASSVLRHHRLPSGTGSPARQRNVGWRDAGAAFVAFTDDDCRPEPDWLERMLTAARSAPGAIVQGATAPDPAEAGSLGAARVRTVRVDPPVPECPTCNILYPRAALQQVGGFDESFPGPAGEDTDLAERVRAQTAAPLVPVPDARVLHAVESFGWVEWARLLWKWQHLPLVVRRHPHVRERLPMRIFWKDAHWRLLLAIAGGALSRRHAVAALLAVPYLRHALLAHGSTPAGVRRATAELPSRAFGDGVEIAAVTYGSLRHRTLLL